MVLPPLPPSTSDVPWPAYVHKAYANLKQIYTSALNALQKEAEGRQIMFHVETIERDAMPVLDALHRTREFGVQEFSDWVLDLEERFDTLRLQAENAKDIAAGR